MTARQKKFAAIATQLVIAVAIINVSPRLRDPLVLTYVVVSLVLWYQSVWKPIKERSDDDIRNRGNRDASTSISIEDTAGSQSKTAASNHNDSGVVTRRRR